MTPYDKIYDAFLAKILEDEWANWDEGDQEAAAEGLANMRQDLKAILDAAVPRFKFPRVPLTCDDEAECFTADLNNEEIQILACYMKCEWLNRNILTWENVKPLYEERDFSQANLLKEFNATLEKEKKNAKELEALYYRSINYKPFNYGKLATQC